jgi:hypothetical protein
MTQSLLAATITIYLIIAPQTLRAQSVPDTQTAGRTVFLPLVVNMGDSASSWQLNPQEQQLEVLFRTDPEQHRQNPRRDDTLSQVARQRAQDMADRNYFSHTSPDGHGPNFWVVQAGYGLPNYYTANGNNIESIGLNYGTADQVWQAWKSSSAHRVHVIAEDPFYATQTDYGLGYVEKNGSRYWVLLTAQHN